MPEICDVFVVFPIYGQFRINPMPDSGFIVCKVYIFINNNFLYFKKCAQN